MSEILLAGASGLIGSKLIKKLKQKNYTIVLLSTQRAKDNGKDILYWNPAKGDFPKLDLSRFSACINFCGAGIFDKPFTDSRKLELLESRTKPIAFLQARFAEQNTKLPHFISASASGYYPNICLNELSEDSTPGTGFISELVKAWETAAHGFKTQAERVSIARIGIVMAKEGGFLSKLKAPMQFFAGAIPGSGKQIISWIHIEDLCDLFIHLMEKQLSGTFNAAAPAPDNLESITRYTGQKIGRPVWLPNIPVFMLNLIFGKERAQLLLCSQHLKSDKIQNSGFTFRFQDSKSALNDLLA